MNKIELVYRPLSWFKLYEKNPRKHDKESIERMAASIREYGWPIPVLARSDGTVCDGHLRVKSGPLVPVEEAPVILCDNWSDAQFKAFRLMANNSVGWSTWDPDLLAQEFADLKALDFDLSLTGFNSNEIDGFTITPDPAEDEVLPEVPAVPVTRAGDLWVMGPHRLLCGDSTDTESVARVMDGKKADMVFSDPPYNVAVVGGDHNPLGRTFQCGNRIANDQMSDSDFKSFLLSAFTVMRSALKEGAAIYIAHADTEGINFRTAFQEAGFKIKQCLIWAKQQFVFGRSDYHWQHEPILYGWRIGASHTFYGERNQGTVWNIDRPMRSEKEHPTQKPVALVEKAICNSSKSGDVLFEPFCGSASTVIACEKTGRLCYAPTLDGDGRTFAEIKACRHQPAV